MAKKKRVLVAGAGIAGMGLAHWLGRFGHDVVLVDRTPAFRALGHFMTLKGTGVAVIRAMGLYDALVTRSLPSRAIAFYDERGRHLRTSTIAALDDTLGGFILLRRADLQQTLHASLPASTTLRYATELAAVDDRGDRVDVSFSDGRDDSFDVVVGADGVHSALRRKMFPEVATRSLDAHYAVFVTEHEHGLGEETRSTFGEGTNISLIPLGEHRVGAQIYLDGACPPPPADGHAWRDYLVSLFAAMPPWVRSAVAALKPDDELFSDRVVMVPATTLAKGRIALLGDAGSCPTFFSGMGASSALQGGYALAHLLDRADDVVDALRRYQERMVPVALRYQRNAHRARAATLCRGLRAHLRNAATRFAPDIVVAKTTRDFYQAEIELDSLAA